MINNIAIIGGGISGLSTAFTLLQAGYKVTLIAADFSSTIVSYKAAAYWFPHHLGSDEKAIAWCKKSYSVFETLSKNTDTGISFIRIKKIAVSAAADDKQWIEFMPNGSFNSIDKTDLPKGYTIGYEANVPLIETQVFLPWLLEQVKQMGAMIQQQKINALQPIAEQFDFVVNCTGLGAAPLCNDASLIPVRGQIVLTEPGYPKHILLDKNNSTYIVPRKDGTIIGGTYEEHIGGAETEPSTLHQLYAKAVDLLPELSDKKIIGNWAGIRPYRPTVRLEKVGNIIHNYGHGGSGYTLSFGCAAAVLDLIQHH